MELIVDSVAKFTKVFTVILCGLVLGCASSIETYTNDNFQLQVIAVEKAFAKTMADRDFSTFKTFIDDEAIFFSGNKVLTGKTQVTSVWQGYFVSALAPFSWQPDIVEVLESGNLALSSGPVFDPQGKVVGGYNSIWRRDRSGQWRIIFDKGTEVCDCEK